MQQTDTDDDLISVSAACIAEPMYAEVGLRGTPCKLCYQLYGEGPVKILFIMGKTGFPFHVPK